MASERRLFAGAFAIFLGVAGLAAADIWADLREGTALSHVIVEGGILFVALLGSAVMAVQLIRTSRLAENTLREAHLLAEELEATRVEADRWRREARDLMQGLGEALDEQFDRWGLSAAEKEVALLLLKGLSHREVADLRSVTEATARQQARAVYRKGGLSGRHDLAAFFLEDLMLPSGGGDSSSTDRAADRAPTSTK